MKVNSGNSGTVLSTNPNMLRNHSLNVKDCGKIDDIIRAGNSSTVEAAKKFTATATEHNAKVAKFLAAVDDLQQGNIPIDKPMQFAADLSRQHVELCAAKLALTLERYSILSKLRDDVHEYNQQAQITLTQKSSEALHTAAGVFSKTNDARLRLELQNRMVEDSRAATTWTPVVLNPFTPQELPGNAIGMARVRLAAAVAAATGLGSFYPMPDQVTVEPKDATGQLSAWQHN